MSQVITLYSIIFALLVFLTSKFRDRVKEAGEFLDENEKQILEGKISSRFIAIGFLSKFFYALILAVAFLLNGFLLLKELPSEVISFHFKVLGLILSVMMFYALFSEVLALSHKVGLLWSDSYQEAVKKWVKS